MAAAEVKLPSMAMATAQLAAVGRVLGAVEVLAAFWGLSLRNEIRVNGPRVITRY